jgi:molybdopterin converting factor subunit 1
MRVKVLYFGMLKDRFGATEEQIALPGKANVEELLGLLRGRTSNSLMNNEAGGADERFWQSLAVAVNREYASPSVVLREGDEVALLPPVSGGYCAECERRVPLADCESEDDAS